MPWRPVVECRSAGDLNAALVDAGGQASIGAVADESVFGVGTATNNSQIGFGLRNVACPADCTVCCALLAYGDSAFSPATEPVATGASTPVVATSIPRGKLAEHESGLKRLLRRFGPSFLVEGCNLEENGVAALACALRQLVDTPSCVDIVDGVDEEAYFDFDLFLADDTTEAPKEDVAGANELCVGGPQAVLGISPLQGAVSEAISFAETGLLHFALRQCHGVPSTAWVPLWQALPSSLVELDFTDNELSDHSAGALCGALQQSGVCLTSLALKKNHCKDIRRLCSLVEDGKVREVDLSENLLNDKSLIQLGEVLLAPKAVLRRLDLSGNRRVSSRGVLLLLPTLRRGILRSLDLHNTSLCDEGALALAAEIPQAPSVEELFCHLTCMTSAGSRSLLRAARSVSRGLRHLTVDDADDRVQWRRCSDPVDLLRFSSCSRCVSQEQ
eukprot:TRINITY_DN27386_c0_g1_i1.p1 TRINITY_DN27386_c0_g1~~TRINITY_DN27386_c0_g1_i1.p1  ORF type:complete len:445 (-),score=60.54 TRINITY_DN27386_c0_g1_i1:11-1345(-)